MSATRLLWLKRLSAVQCSEITRIAGWPRVNLISAPAIANKSCDGFHISAVHSLRGSDVAEIITLEYPRCFGSRSTDGVPNAAIEGITVRDVKGAILVKFEEVPEQCLRDSAARPSHNREPAVAHSWRAQLKHWTGLDRAISFVVMARLWSAFAGVVTVLMIARFLTPNEQGYYYTFYSLVALQIVFELGFCFVVLQWAAHERARLVFAPDGRVEGDSVALSRLASVLKISIRWYTVAAVLMVATLLPAGFYFFDAHQRAGLAVPWEGPWFVLVMAVALNFLMGPVCAFVEGCGFVTLMAQMHLGQVLLGSLLAWAAMATHHGLYSPAMMVLGVAMVQALTLTMPRLRRVLTSLLRRTVNGNSVDWRREIWPFQWRIAVTWLSSYFLTQFITPVLFSYQGSVTAGRMGMSLSIATSIGTVGLAWMSTKASPFGSMVARGEIRELNRLFFRTFCQSTVLVTAGAAAFFSCLLIIRHNFPKLAMRVLSPWAFALLLLTMVMNHVLSSEALYMRAHKREPLLVQAVVVAIVLGTSTLILGRIFGVNAVTIGYFVLGGLLSLTWGTYVFFAKRREWYGRTSNHMT